jgi:hypothetical protein
VPAAWWHVWNVPVPPDAARLSETWVRSSPGASGSRTGPRPPTPFVKPMGPIDVIVTKDRPRGSWRAPIVGRRREPNSHCVVRRYEYSLRSFTREHRAYRTARVAVCHTRPSSGPEILCEEGAKFPRGRQCLDGLLFFERVTPSQRRGSRGTGAGAVARRRTARVEAAGSVVVRPSMVKAHGRDGIGTAAKGAPGGAEGVVASHPRVEAPAWRGAAQTQRQRR